MVRDDRMEAADGFCKACFGGVIGVVTGLGDLAL